VSRGDPQARIRRLGDCAEVLPGFSVRGRMEHDPAGTHQLVVTRHLTDGVPYVYHPSHELRVDPGRRDTNPYRLGRGDVLFMSRGTLNRAWVIEQVPEPTIAPVSFYVIRPTEGLDGRYLAWYLNQVPAQAAIEQIRTGAGTPIVQRKAFQELEIVAPPLERQREVADLADLLARERELRALLAEAAERAHATIGRQLIHDLRAAARETRP
jgi:hypothetical protein